MARDILEYFQRNRDAVRVLASKFTIQNPGAINTGLYQSDVPSGVPGILEGKTFCITGAVEFPGKRSALQDYISSLGGCCVSSVTRKVDYLITNTPNSGSNKNKAALAFGCKVISEAQFMRMARGG
jgi:DNA ligase (NAD+)